MPAPVLRSWILAKSMPMLSGTALSLHKLIHDWRPECDRMHSRSTEASLVFGGWKVRRSLESDLHTLSLDLRAS